MSKHWSQITHYAGFDWAKEAHDVIVLDSAGQIVADFSFPHSAQGWSQWREKIRASPALAVTIETSQGAALEQLLESGAAVYPVHPQSAKLYRQRKVPRGNKTNRLDAWSLASALRMEGQDWRQLAALDPLVAELRLLCRDEAGLIGQRTALINQLRAALYEYYPAELEAFQEWDRPGAWAFVEAFPTPQALRKAGPRQWEKFLHRHRLYRPQTAPKRLEIFARAEAFCGSPAVTSAKSRLAVTCAKMLRLLETQLAAYRAEIERLFERHPDHDLFGSLPGAGPKLGPRLLSELGEDRALYESAQSLQCFAGTAPVNYNSGSLHVVQLRRACNKHLRQAVHQWANLSRARSAWAETYYQAHRARGQSHACALRCLGQRWLKILWKMWQTRTPYQTDLHARNQLAHGSWLLCLQSAKD
jgi:transposase